MFSLYMHITPSGKVYIGITSKEDVNDRFGPNGILYRNQIFGRAIKKYGWDNIEHFVIKTNLTEEEAKQEEIKLIALYDSTNPNYGYNSTLGGDIPYIYGKHHTEETKHKIRESNKGKIITQEMRDKISSSVRCLWENPEYRAKQDARIFTEETRQKLSKSHMGHKHSEEQKLKISNSNKGKHNFTDEQKRQIAETVRLQHQKEREMGIVRKCGNSCSRGKKWYNNGITNIRSKDGCPEGFVPGRIKRK